MLKKIIYSLAVLFYGAEAKSQSKIKPENISSSPKSIYEYSFKTLDGKEFSFATLKGKKILIVNTASECGYTPQYADLEKLHDTYKDKLVIIGFPANNFGSQEPGSDADIKNFCQKNYGVEFLMMSKSDVVGTTQNPIYQWLSNPNSNGWNNNAPNWNFCKYLIDEEGVLLGFFPSAVKPTGKEITSLL
jgi:glutathione peroxidase